MYLLFIYFESHYLGGLALLIPKGLHGVASGSGAGKVSKPRNSGCHRCGGPHFVRSCSVPLQKAWFLLCGVGRGGHPPACPYFYKLFYLTLLTSYSTIYKLLYSTSYSTLLQVILLYYKLPVLSSSPLSSCWYLLCSSRGLGCCIQVFFRKTWSLHFCFFLLCGVGRGIIRPRAQNQAFFRREF